MLNNLTLHTGCTITTTDGASISGIYGGVETQHGDWSILVRQGPRTLSIPIETIDAASSSSA